MRLEFLRDVRVVERIGHGRDAQVVLGRRADHAGAADVDVRPRHLGSDAILGDGLLERIEVDDDHVDRERGEPLQVGLVGVVVGLGEEAEVDLEVERLDEPALHFGLAGVVGNGNESIARLVAEDFLDLGIGAAGGVDLYAWACLDECGDESLKPRLVAHAHEDVLYLHPAVDFCNYVALKFPSIIPFSPSGRTTCRSSSAPRTRLPSRERGPLCGRRDSPRGRFPALSSRTFQVSKSSPTS